MGGVKVKLAFPSLMKYFKDLRKSGNNIAINDARLFFRVNSTDPTTYSYKVPPQLDLLRLNSSDTLFVPPPDYGEGTAFYGGTYDSQNQQYVFRIPHYLQDVLDEKITGDKGFYMIIDGASENAQRVILNGTNTTGILKAQEIYIYN